MNRIEGSAGRWTAVIAAVLIVAGIACSAEPGQEKKGTPLGHVLKKTLLLFPFDVPSTAAPNADELSNLLTELASSRLIASGNYAVTTYYRAWPPVARLHNDQQLSEADVIPPYAEDNRKGLKIGRLVGYDTVCVGSVDDYQYNEADKQVTLTVSARILSVEDGKVLKNITLSASSPKGGAAAKEEELNLAAGRAAMEKLMAQLAPVGAVAQQPVEPVKPVVAKKKRSNDWVWGLLAVGIGLAIGLSGGGGGGAGIETPPPPP